MRPSRLASIRGCRSSSATCCSCCIRSACASTPAGGETRERDGRMVEVSYWNYRTLEGHVEAGQRDYEVRKWLDTGEVDFRTHAVSRPAETNALIRVGFLLLGRHKQVEF